jgi:hypothetical protein
MDRARLAEKTRTKEFEDTVGLDECAPKAMDGDAIIARMGVILRKTDWVRDLVRDFVDDDSDPEPIEKAEGTMVERGYRLRLEWKTLSLTPAGTGDKPMIDEIKLDFDDFSANRDW